VLSGVLKKASSGECVWVFLKAGGEMPIHMFLYLDVQMFCNTRIYWVLKAMLSRVYINMHTHVYEYTGESTPINGLIHRG